MSGLANTFPNLPEAQALGRDNGRCVSPCDIPVTAHSACVRQPRIPILWPFPPKVIAPGTIAPFVFSYHGAATCETLSYACWAGYFAPTHIVHRLIWISLRVTIHFEQIGTSMIVCATGTELCPPTRHSPNRRCSQNNWFPYNMAPLCRSHATNAHIGQSPPHHDGGLAKKEKAKPAKSAFAWQQRTCACD